MARSTLTPAAGSASSLTAAGGSASTLSATGDAGTSALTQVDALKSELKATETDRGTLVSLAGDVTFDFNKATIRPDARPTLDKVAELIKAQNAGAVAIEGHTDSKGNDAYNQRLSQARAIAVRDYLISVRMVDGTKLTMKGVGELRPVAPNMAPDGKDDEVGRAKNRRVEIVLGK